MPPGGVKEHFKIQHFRLKSNQNLVGYMTNYFGYQEEDVVFINFLFIDPNLQRLGYSKEVIGQFLKLLKDTKYKRVRLLVKLKNWPAIRFWTSMKFYKIVSYYGDSVLSEETFAGLVLEKEI